MTDELIKAASRLLTAYAERRKTARFADGLGDIFSEIMRLEEAYKDAIGQPRETPRIPYENVAAGHGRDKDTVETHESFGMIQFSRVSGGAHLFGSAVESHQHFVKIGSFVMSVAHKLGMKSLAKLGEGE